MMALVLIFGQDRFNSFNFKRGPHPTRAIIMTTQINIPDALHTQAKTYAAQNGTTLKALVNQGLAELLKRKATQPLRIREVKP